MSKDTENQVQTTNSYASITRSSGSSKTACVKCDAKKLPFCVCSKSDAEENESEEKSSASIEETKDINLMLQTNYFSAPYSRTAEELNKEEPILLLSDSQDEFQFALKPNIKLTDIKALLEQFIMELAQKNLAIYYNDTQENTLAITINHPEHFIEFFNRLRDRDLIVIKQDQAQKIENIVTEGNSESFNPTPFKMTLTPY